MAVALNKNVDPTTIRSHEHRCMTSARYRQVICHHVPVFRAYVPLRAHKKGNTHCFYEELFFKNR
jgi:hypothetical protein